MVSISTVQSHLARICLLSKQPKVCVNDSEVTFIPPALKLLVYLAESGETEYDRDELIRLVHGSATVLARDSFRKKTLYLIRHEFPAALPKSKGTAVVKFSPEQFWVDSRVFAERAQNLISGNRVFDKEDYLSATEVLDLYKAPFLAEYHAKSSGSGDNARFPAWQKSHQHDLELLYQELLDRMIPFCLHRERHWEEARRYAETWRQSGSTKPLQYLIWLAAREHSGLLKGYLAELRTYEEAGELSMGRSWSEWNSVLKADKSIPLSWVLQTESPVNTYAAPVDVAVEEQFDRQHELEHMLTLFTNPRQEVIFAVNGLPGAGKSALARAAAQLLLEQHPNYKVVRLELTAPLDLELLCNNILNDLERQDLLTLDYAKKRQRLIQLVQAPNLVFIVDEGYTTYFADPKMLNQVLELLRNTHTMLVGREMPRFKHYVIDLRGLDIEPTKHFLVSRVAWLKEIEEDKLAEIAALTGGLPLLLHIVVGGLKKELGRVHSLIHDLQANGVAANEDWDVYRVYDGVLAWLWQYLESKDKDLLYALSLFAPEDGTTRADLDAVLATIMPENRFPHRIDRLIDMHLVERHADHEAEVRYVLHPIILDFVQRRARESSRPHAKMIELAYIRYLLDFIDQHHDQAERLDDHKYSIFRAFELVIFGENHRWARPRVVEALDRIFPYFEVRGSYSTAERLITQVLALGEFSSVETQIQMLRHAARIAYLQADGEQSLQRYQAALDIALSAEVTHRYASLHHDIAQVHLQKGHYEAANQSLADAERAADPVRQQPLLYAIWSNQGASAFRQGRVDVALQYYQKALDQLGDDDSSLVPELQPIAQYIHNALGIAFTERGDYQVALKHFRRSMALARQFNYPQLSGYLYLNMGLAYCYLGEYEEADDCFTKSEAIAAEIHHFELQTLNVLNRGLLVSRRDAHEEAIRLHRMALDQAETYELTWMKPRILISLGKTYLRATDSQYALASQRFAEVLTEPELAAVYISHALYGIALSWALQHRGGGDHSVEATLDLLLPVLDAATCSAPALPLDEIADHLDWAHAAFQRDFDHLERLERYRIVEVLRIWLAQRSSA